MSLGFSRDSIGDLQSLVHNQEVDYTKAPSTIKLSSSQLDTNDEDLNDCNNDYSFIEGDSFVEEQQLQSLAPMLETKIEIPETPPPSLHRSESVSSSSSTATTVEEYSGFQFNYGDYYTDPYAVTDYNRDEDNPFCCLFAFLQKNSNSNKSGEMPTDGDKSAFVVTTEEPKDRDIIFLNPLETKHGYSVTMVKNVLAFPQTLRKSPMTVIQEGEDLFDLLQEEKNSSISQDISLPNDVFSSNRKDELLSTSSSTSTSTTSHGNHAVKPMKGILKKTVVKPQITAAVNMRNSNNTTATSRRSILPSYEVSLSSKTTILGDSDDQSFTKPSKSVQFSTMARVMPVLPRSELSLFTRSRIWWQRSDYEDFKKAGRIIAKAMVQGGSEIWLQTSDAWGKKQSSQGSSIKDSPEHISALRKYEVNQNGEEKDVEEDIGHKWWCKFGHSRRGLEHIVSIQEGKQRQKLVNLSISSVLEEQRRQRASNRKDIKKLAAVSMQYTSWAKDLAIAAAAADAEAVETNFHSQAKDRIAHLTTKLRAANVSQDGHTPCANFILAANVAFRASLLDANIPKAMASPEPSKFSSHTSRESDLSKKAAGFQYQESPVTSVA